MTQQEHGSITPARRWQLLINNEHVNGLGDVLRIVNPSTEEPLAEFAGASVAQVHQAVKAARDAFDSGIWRDPAFRKDKLLRLADLLEQHQDDLMESLVREIGTPVNLKVAHIDTPIQFLRWFAEHGTRDRTRNLGFNPSLSAVSSVVYRPVGVVAAITAFNFPLLIGLTKVGAALASGCTTVLLSSPVAPLTILMLGDLIRQAGIPAGVVNILAGSADVGRALTGHADVNKVSFTGSVEVGRQVMQQAAAHLHPSVLELGGKSAAIMLPGVDFGKYADWLHARYARNAGQGCGSPTRILVESSRYEEFVAVSRKAYQNLKVGDPHDPTTLLGPVISAAQRDRIEARIAAAIEAGSTIIAGGGRPAIHKGWYLNPTLVGDIDNNAKLAREEIFGPVAVVIKYSSVEEAIRIANDSDLGLKAFLFGKPDECLKLVPHLHVGTVHINGGSGLRPDAPLPGCKSSGVGSEWGEDGLREFVVPQHIDLALG